MSKITEAARLSAALLILIVVFGGLYRLMHRLNVTGRHQSQLRRLKGLEETLTAEFGPITLAAWARAEQVTWPR